MGRNGLKSRPGRPVRRPERNTPAVGALFRMPVHDFDLLQWPRGSPVLPEPALCRGGSRAEGKKIQRHGAEGVEVKRDGARSGSPSEETPLALDNLVDQSGRPSILGRKDPAQFFGIADIRSPRETASTCRCCPKPGQHSL